MLYSHVTLLMLRVMDVITKTSVQQSARMLVAEIPGDIQIGALFPMHRQIAGSEGCGAIWEQYGIQRAEVAILTIQELNKILPFKLGISIRDSCWTERIAMEQTIAFLREGVTQCTCCQTAGCQKKSNPVVAIVGPAKSSTTIAVQNLLQVFRIPQIGYAATTTDLSDKEQFGYYLRVVPSDAWQAMAISQLLMHFRWTYIAVVYSAGNYGEKGFEALERLTHSPGIDVCIAQAQKVKTIGENEEFEKVLLMLNELNPRPQVIVCFCEGRSLNKLFQAQKALRLGQSSLISNYNNTTNFNKNIKKIEAFQWIGSDGWADRLDVVEGVETEAAGSFSIRIHSPRVEKFEPYYYSLEPTNHSVKNPWFREFWQQKFKCLLTVPKDDTFSELCDINSQNLSVGYEQDPKLSQVMNAIRVVGYALRDMYNDKCKILIKKQNKIKSINNNNNNSNQLIFNEHFGLTCPEMETINGTLLFKYMMNISFEDEFQQEISFDQSGDPPAWYDILNYIGYDGFRKAGDWKKGVVGNLKEKFNFGINNAFTYKLKMKNKELMFYDKTSKMPESVCSKPCNFGQRRRQTTACCWICEPCAEGEIVKNNLCKKCPFGEWPDTKNRTICIRLQHEYLEITASIAPMIAIIFASLGIICAFLVILLFILHNSTPATTRELSYIILGGIVACYLCSFALLSKPSFIACLFSRILPPIAFASIYSALFTKTNRIARILAGSKKRILTKKPRFLSTFSQVIITWTLVGIQCIIVVFGLINEFPKASFDENFAPKRMVLTCTISTMAFMAPFVWNFILALTASFTFSLSASIALSLLFFPKCFIILLRPEKNVRSSYTTTKLIRCHFGNAPSTFTDSKHGISFLSKTRNSSQSLSIGAGSCPTRTASLHVVNQNNINTNNIGNGGGGSGGGGGGIISNLSGSYSIGNQLSDNKPLYSQHLHHHHYSPRRVNIQTQTEVSTIAFNNQENGLGSRITRTFSVIGGGAGCSGSISSSSGKGLLYGSPSRKKVGIRGERYYERSNNNKERKNRRKTLDDDVLQLIESCRRYQDERILINPTTIGNLLLEETSEETFSETEGRGEKVTEMLAGTIRGLAQTVSRTATSGGIKCEDLKRTDLIKEKIEKDNEIIIGCSPESILNTSLPPTTSSYNISSTCEKGEGEMMHVNFILENEKESEIKILKNKNEDNKGKRILNKTTSVEDNFENLLRSKGFNIVHFGNPTQL